MGFFDRLAGKSTPSGANGAPVVPVADGSGVTSRLVAAREKLEMKDLPGAMVVYEEVLAEAGDRADVLVMISGDLGSTGNIPQIIDLIAPRYDALRHGPATGINLIQAFLAVGNADAAQHVLDILYSLKKPELEERLHGFSNAVAELLQNGVVKGIPHFASQQAGPDGTTPQPTFGVALVSISRPIWSYGLESVTDALPKKEGKLRRIAFAQLAVPGGYPDPEEAMKLPED